MDIITDVSQFIDSKVNEYVRKSQVLTTRLLQDYFPFGTGCLITGSWAKLHYGFDVQIPRDKDLVLIQGDLRDIYLLANDLMPKVGFTGSFGSIVVEKPEELHYKPPFASFVHNNIFIEVFDNTDNLSNPWHSQGDKYVPLSALIECAREWNREKDRHFLGLVKACVSPLIKDELPF